MKKIIVGMVAAFLSGPLFAAVLTDNATVISVAKTHYGVPLIILSLSSGSGACGNTSVTFAQNKIPGSADEKLSGMDHILAMALSAKSTGSKVRIESLAGTSCGDAALMTVK